MPKVSLEQISSYYGMTLPELKRIGQETRTACFLHCGKQSKSGDRALAIQEQHPAKQWHCHQYECHRSGNLVSLLDLVKPGDHMNGRPRGERFKAIAHDLQEMAEGRSTEASGPPATPQIPPPPPTPPRNLPLKDSPNERARTLTELDTKLLVDPKDMPPKVSAYFRRRPFLSLEACRSFRLGYLPRDTGEDKSGGTLRGHIVYPYLDEQGEVLCWFGRDPAFEEKQAIWIAGDKTGKEPEKFHFVKGFMKGLEVWGQERLKEEANRTVIQQIGLVTVEGPNDVINLASLGIPSIAICSNIVTEAQAEKIAHLARTYGNGIISLMLDNDEAGDNGMRRSLPLLAAAAPTRLLWSRDSQQEQFVDRQPESITREEWHLLDSALRCQ
ncbi:MAG: toprim domain-containing protein [Gemmatales bacterium]